MADFILPADHERTSILVRRREIPVAVTVVTTEEIEIVDLDLDSREEPEPAPEPMEFLPPDLPAGKEFFRIREVSDLLELDPQKLRDWEDDFSMVRPTKSGGQRVYRRSDVETLSFIRHCILDEELDVAETRRRVKAWKKRDRKAAAAQASPALVEIAHDLRELLRLAQSGPF